MFVLLQWKQGMHWFHYWQSRSLWSFLWGSDFSMKLLRCIRLQRNVQRAMNVSKSTMIQMDASWDTALIQLTATWGAFWKPTQASRYENYTFVFDFNETTHKKTLKYFFVGWCLMLSVWVLDDSPSSTAIYRCGMLQSALFSMSSFDYRGWCFYFSFHFWRCHFSRSRYYIGVSW